ncbi:hypothetical protein CO2235_MP20252 [Cupriavidus oxalaticus]|uniref:Uncharacterized protein n=1 Tax=Cupriavidus oxalaticus TaxID=96344 RepID=A0A375GKY3_9BURK|nr:hypothetical protein CO2235_MP20252 [Cupriavidus oxalaticus]
MRAQHGGKHAGRHAMVECEEVEHGVAADQQQAGQRHMQPFAPRGQHMAARQADGAEHRQRHRKAQRQQGKGRGVVQPEARRDGAAAPQQHEQGCGPERGGYRMPGVRCGARLRRAVVFGGHKCHLSKAWQAPARGRANRLQRRATRAAAVPSGTRRREYRGRECCDAGRDAPVSRVAAGADARRRRAAAAVRQRRTQAGDARTATLRTAVRR